VTAPRTGRNHPLQHPRRRFHLLKLSVTVRGLLALPGVLRPQLLHKPRQLPVRLQRLREHILWRRISTRVRQHPSRNRHGTQQTPA
jgi:hypothetical protein